MSDYFPSLAGRVRLSVGESRFLSSTFHESDPAPRILIMTPDKLNFNLYKAAKHAGANAFFRNLKWVVFDEVHSLSGSFGSNCCLLLARLRNFCYVHRRASEIVGDTTKMFQTVLLSASVGNPAALFNMVTGEDHGFELISVSGV